MPRAASAPSRQTSVGIANSQRGSGGSTGELDGSDELDGCQATPSVMSRHSAPARETASLSVLATSSESGSQAVDGCG